MVSVALGSDNGNPVNLAFPKVRPMSSGYRPDLLEVPQGINDIGTIANGPFARAKEIEWPTGKTRARPA
jgi:hypothetical protein